MPIRCRVCVGCRAHYQNRVIARIAQGVQTFGEGRASLLTLTSSPGTSWPLIMAKWSSMAKALRAFSPRLEYAAVKEVGPATGMKHLHVVCANWLFTPFETISAMWESRIGAPGVDIRRFYGRVEDIPGYVAKYVSKTIGDTGVHKVVTYSKHWPKLRAQSTARFLGWLSNLNWWRVMGMTAEGHIIPQRPDGRFTDCSCFGDVVELADNGHVSEGDPVESVKILTAQIGLSYEFTTHVAQGTMFDLNRTH